MQYRLTKEISSLSQFSTEIRILAKTLTLIKHQGFEKNSYNFCTHSIGKNKFILNYLFSHYVIIKDLKEILSSVIRQRQHGMHSM